MKRLLVLPVVVALAGGLAAAPAAAQTVPPAAVINRDFPDPEILQVDGTFHAYSTSSSPGRVPYATAPAATGPWTVRGDALPQKPSWAGSGGFWAPDVSRRADGRYLMYFTGPSAAAGRMCLGAALADSPAGPFVPTSGQPLVCNAGEGGDIDPSSFVDTNGARYLLYKNDGNAIGQPTIIWLQPTAADGITFTGARRELLRNNRPEDQGVIEAPVLVRRASQYVLFYSAGVYTTGNYHTSYAVSGALNGPYTRAYRPLITTTTLDGAVNGPGGADVVGNRIFFHGHLAAGGRGMYTAALGWANDYPVVRGSRVRYEVERGTLNHAYVRSGAAGASQGAVAAGIDFADSWADTSVFAPVAGTYTVHIGYAAGYGEAQHTLTVNGGAAQVVTYPDRGWDNWTQVAAHVTLNAGFNTVRLQFRGRWAELDYLEVA
ncbi:glycoside hydrolase [Actinophytocola xinjiangensis]|uniref:Glycoside hydrolase n=1 Tax=Actinophytocola xinjiangensis TaxID=485602 RepID=A0A7Z1AV27_9PSEU|nr:family 43 glycosylhydrolase [Actinophytocola xinjiangensis]OLF06757.1 glycoside hydrolase [Actinophytocola xinjiangensis]